MFKILLNSFFMYRVIELIYHISLILFETWMLKW